MNFGQEIAPADWPTYEIERAPTSAEMAAWQKARKASDRVFMKLRICELMLTNLSISDRFIKDNGKPPPNIEAAQVAHFIKIRTDARAIEVAMERVKANDLAVQFVDGDIDIVKPPQNDLGAIWIPIAIGAIIITGIIARWAYLEKETGKLTDHFNGLLKRTDDHLCKDPNSEACADWEETKAAGGYYERETVIGNIKDAIKGTGKVLKKGLGIGALIALPLLAMYLLPKGKR